MQKNSGNRFQAINEASDILRNQLEDGQSFIVITVTKDGEAQIISNFHKEEAGYILREMAQNVEHQDHTDAFFPSDIIQ